MLTFPEFSFCWLISVVVILGCIFFLRKRIQ
ncbi:MAG: PEF-CTERM sorting domain-containing protein [Chryseobacterium sp.]|nr:PEF-CTERM sorting domain-containing protein [Chryseobacterium sp.]